MVHKDEMARLLKDMQQDLCELTPDKVDAWHNTLDIVGRTVHAAASGTGQFQLDGETLVQFGKLMNARELKILGEALSDNQDSLKEEFGAQLNDTVVPFLKDANALLDKAKAQLQADAAPATVVEKKFGQELEDELRNISKEGAMQGTREQRDLTAQQDARREELKDKHRAVMDAMKEKQQQLLALEKQDKAAIQKEFEKQRHQEELKQLQEELQEIEAALEALKGNIKSLEKELAQAESEQTEEQRQAEQAHKQDQQESKQGQMQEMLVKMFESIINALIAKIAAASSNPFTAALVAALKSMMSAFKNKQQAARQKGKRHHDNAAQFRRQANTHSANAKDKAAQVGQLRGRLRMARTQRDALTKQRSTLRRQVASKNAVVG